MNVEKKFLKAIKDFNLISPDDKLIIAYSTGIDSSVLTYLFLKFKNYLKINKLALAYLNHKIRPESDVEEKFAISFAKSLNLEIYTKEVDVKKVANKLKKSVEQVGREERYKFFTQILQEKEFNKIATGHHLSDLAETMTLWFIQGNKNGLKGFKPQEGNIIRPLYLIKKEEIYKYAEEKDIKFNEDYTNYSMDYMRNKVRHEIIPKIKEINPSFEKSMLNLSYFLNIDEHYFEKALSDFGYDVDFIDMKQFEDDALLYRIIDKWVYTKIGCKLSYQQIKNILKLKNRRGSKKINICNNYLLTKRYNKVYITLEKSAQPVYFEYKLKIGEKVYIKEINKVIESFVVKKPNMEIIKNEKEIACFDINEDNLEFTVRSRKRGDKFKPFGSSMKKLKDVMIDLKIPVDMRDNIPLVVFQDKILWIAGHKRSDFYPVNEHSKNVVCFKLKEV